MMKKILACLLAGALAVGFLTGCADTVKQDKNNAPEPVSYKGLMSQWKQTAKEDNLTCWYTSEDDKSLMETAAKNFETEYGIKVNLVYYDGVSLFDDMNQANQNGTGPDVYLIGNDQLELAKNSGMAEENTWMDDEFWSENYPKVAKDAVTYQNKQYGYPVYFDTYCLVYDANLLENAPASIDDILTFLDAYEDTGSTKAVFRWDVADSYINSMFIASYADLFGENGDMSSQFKVNDEQSVAAMEYFQSLSAYLWMDKSNISHDTVMNRIKDGTLVLGLCKSDILPTLYEMADQKTTEEVENESSENENATDDEAADSEDTPKKEDATNYQISYVPSLTAELSSSTFSTTYGAYINPYGKDTSLGNMFALYLSYANAKNQFAGNCKLPVINQKDGFDSMQAVIYAQYLNSVPVPKVMVLGDYLLESGIAFDAIWEGKDAKEQLDWLQNTMEQKITK